MEDYKLMLCGEYENHNSKGVVTIEPNGIDMDEALSTGYPPILLEIGEIRKFRSHEEEYFDSALALLTIEDAKEIVATLQSMIQYVEQNPQKKV